MFSISAYQQACLNAVGGYKPVIRVAVKDLAGTYHYVTGDYGGLNFFQSLDVQQSIDNPCLTFTLELKREAYQWSMSPLMSGSAVNLATYLTPGSGYSPLLDVGRMIKAEFAIVPVGETPQSTDWQLLFDGYIDTIDPGDSDNIQIQGRDRAAKCSDTWIETERVYGLATSSTQGPVIWQPGMTASVGMQCVPGSNLNGFFYQCTAITSGITGTTEPTWPASGSVVDGGVTWTEQGSCVYPGTGVAVQTVMQSILTDNGCSDTVSTPVSPGWLLLTFKQQRQAVFDALRQLAQQIGWDLRYLYNSGAGVLTFYQPTRTSPPVLYTFPKASVLRVEQAQIDISTVRNAVQVVYNNSLNLDASGNPTRAVVVATDGTSIATYGRRFMEVSEDSTSKIDTTGEATTLATACVNDLSKPLMSFQPVTQFFPFVELNDFYTFKADGLHFDSDQSLAVIGISHHFDTSSQNTTFTLHGSPCSGYLSWHDTAAATTGFPGAARMGANAAHASTEMDGPITLTASQTVSGVRINAAFNRVKDSRWDGFEYHLSTSNSSPPSSSTLQHVGKNQSHEVHGLIPSVGYYATVVPIRRNDSKLVRGLPLAWTAVQPLTVNPIHILPDTIWNDAPPNADFGSFTQGSGSPPDRWSMVSGVWGAGQDIVQDATTVFDGLYSLEWTALNSGAPTIQSDYFPIKPNSDYFLDYVFRNDNGTGSFSVTLQWYTAKGTGNGSTVAPVYTVPAANTWERYSARVPPPAGTRYCRIQVAYTVVLGHVMRLGFCRMVEVRTPEAWNLVGTAGQPAFAANWANFGGGWAAAAFMKDHNGFVHLKGLVAASAAQANQNTIFTLPVGYRPAESHQFATKWSGGGVDKAGLMIVSSSGAVQIDQALANGDNISIDFTFLGEQ